MAFLEVRVVAGVEEEDDLDGEIMHFLQAEDGLAGQFPTASCI